MKFYLYRYAVVFLLIASACVPIMPEPAEPSSTDTEAPTVSTATSEPAPVDTPDIAASPPAATMMIGEQIQQAGVGTYCWTGEGAEAGMCVDKIGIPTPNEALSVASPFTAQFNIPVEEAPQSLALRAIAVTQEDQVSGIDDPSQIFWTPKEGQTIEVETSATPETTIDLAPGLYVLNLFVSWPTRGDASYGFLVEITAASVQRSPDLDPLKELASAALAGNPQQMANFVRLTETGCTFADGLGGPPKCLEGEEEGALVEVLPIGGVEGHFVRPEEVSQGLDIQAESLVGIYRISEEAFSDVYWPAGEYGLLFATAGISPVSLIVENGQIVRIDYHLVDDPEDFLQTIPAGDVLIGPAEVETWLAP